MIRRVRVENNQSIWDLAIQEYGSYDAVKQLIIDNPTICNFETNIDAGIEIIITGEPYNKPIFDYLRKKIIKPATAVFEVFNSSWILVTGTWNDNGFWDDNALWID